MLLYYNRFQLHVDLAAVSLILLVAETFSGITLCLTSNVTVNKIRFPLRLFTQLFSSAESIPANIYFFKVNNRNTRERCDICSKLTIKTTFSIVSIVDFKQVNVN